MPIMILSFLKGYWKQIAIVVLAFAVVGGAYVKGRRDCARSMEREVAKELEKRVGEVQKERDRTDRIRDSIRSDRESRPVDDDRDSCLLSNDPYQVDCLRRKQSK